MQRGAVHQDAQIGLFVVACEDVQLFFGAVELPGEAKQLKQEGAAFAVGRLMAKFFSESLNGFTEFTRLIEFDGSHEIVPETERSGQPVSGAARE